MACRKASDKIEEETDNTVDIVDTLSLSSTSTITADPPTALLSLRSSTVRVLRELDHLLTMDTLIYFVQAFFELLLLAFFATYRQPPLENSLPVQSATRRRIQQRVRKKVRKEKQIPDPYDFPAHESSNPPNVVNTVILNHPAQISDTGPVVTEPCSVRPPPPQLQLPQHPVIKPRLPPPPSLAIACTRLTIPLDSQAILVAITDTPSSQVTPIPQSPSQLRQKPPRRKPVPLAPVSVGAAQFEPPRVDSRGQSTPSSSPPPIIITVPPIPSQPTVVEPTDKLRKSRQPKRKSKKTSPPLVRKTSAKFIRPPLPVSPPSDPGQVSTVPSDLVIPVTPQSEGPRVEVPAASGKSSVAVPLERKSSAKFVRPPIQLLESNSPKQQVSETKSLDQKRSEQLVVEQSPTLPLATTLQASESAAAENNRIQLQTPLGLIAPIPQRHLSQPRVDLFPPRPAIAVVQTTPLRPEPPTLSSPLLPESSTLSSRASTPSPPPSELSALPSFPELPPLIPANPRISPPPPSIPRFPSPQKFADPSPPTTSASVSSTPSSHSKAPMRSKGDTSMATIASDIVPSPEQLTHQETTYRLTQQAFPHEWDPSQDANLFSLHPSSVHKTVFSTGYDCRFSSHGSVTSRSSTESPNNESRDRLSSSKLDRSRHTRTLSSNSQHLPSQAPSHRVRPHSAGSLSSGSEPPVPAFLLDNSHLKPGDAAALLSHAETLNLYRQNAKKAVDNPATQYEFAIFMMDAAREATNDLNGLSPSQRNELLKEGLSILRRLADRGYPQAQYYLADCYSNGIGCKNTAPDLEKAFPLFVLAAKHGHVEANFRTALAYENAWGCRRDPLKAVQFLR